MRLRTSRLLVFPLLLSLISLASCEDPVSPQEDLSGWKADDNRYLVFAVWEDIHEHPDDLPTSHDYYAYELTDQGITYGGRTNVTRVFGYDILLSYSKEGGLSIGWIDDFGQATWTDLPHQSSEPILAKDTTYVDYYGDVSRQQLLYTSHGDTVLTVAGRSMTVQRVDEVVIRSTNGSIDSRTSNTLFFSRELGFFVKLYAERRSTYDRSSYLLELKAFSR
jgi:hypothetical protein